MGLLIICLAISSCKNPKKGYQRANSGLKYRFVEQNADAESGKIGDYYVLNIEFLDMKDSLFNKFKSHFELEVPSVEGGMMEAVAMMNNGDSASFILNADSFYKEFEWEKPDVLYGQTQMKVNLRVTDILSPVAFDQMKIDEEKEEIDAFLRRKGWNATLDTASGIWYEITHKNPEGKQIEIGDEVGITYFYYTLYDRPFAKIKDGDLMSVKVGDPQRIPGISKALTFTREGEFIRAVLPFSQAFGANGMGAYVPEYATVVIELDVVTLQNSGGAVIEIAP